MIWTHLQEDTQFWAALFAFRMRGGRFPRACAHRWHRIHILITTSPISGAEAVHIPYHVSLFQSLHASLAIFEHHAEKARGFELSVFG